MLLRVSFARSAMFALVILLVVGMAGSSQAAPRMYTGELIIVAFGNDTSTGSTEPFALGTGIPLIGNCNTRPTRPMETFTFPTYPTSASPSDTIMFTVPQYGGAVKTIDTNGDGIADLVPGCGAASRLRGNPLTGGGTMETTRPAGVIPGAGFIVPKSALSVVGSASVAQSGNYAFEVHKAELRNDGSTGSQGVFGQGLGGGDMDVYRPASGAYARATSSGGSKFGGVMRLLGTYYSVESYFYNGTVGYAARYTWLFQYLGDGEPDVTSVGVVQTGNLFSAVNYGFTLTSGYPFTSYVYQEVFRWTDGNVRVTGGRSTDRTILSRNGFDNRTPKGRGQIQLVTPMLTHWVGAGDIRTSSIGIMKITFAPEPNQWLMLGAGVSMLALLFRSSRKS